LIKKNFVKEQQLFELKNPEDIAFAEKEEETTKTFGKLLEENPIRRTNFGRKRRIKKGSLNETNMQQHYK